MFKFRFQIIPSFLIPIYSFFFIICAYQPIEALADFNFGAAGDFGCNSSTEATVTNIKNKNPELVLALGDYSYRSTADCWLDRIASIDSITRINIGNHEDQASEDFNKYMSHFGLTLPYYSFNYQNVHILTMTYESGGYSTSSPQYNFVINDLQSASENPNINWIIVSVHEWVYRASSSNPHNDDLAEVYHPLFDQYGVDLVLSGHDHKYHRTFPLKYNPSEPVNPIVTDNNQKDYINPLGQVYAVVGTGGVNLAPIVGSSPFIASAQDDYFGQLDIKFTNNGNKLEAKFYRNGNGNILDSFSITKTPVEPPIATNQDISVIKNTPSPITLSATDPNNDPLTYSIIQQPITGTISGGTGAFRTYTPKNQFTGSDSFKFKANDGTTDSNIATVTVSVIPVPQGSYNNAPSLALTGSNYDETPSSPSLKLTQFSAAAWFKTSTNFASTAHIVNKGGIGSDSAGQNMNYGIWMTSSEKIQAGFEAVNGGADYFVTSSNSYSDGQWHYAVVTYDGSTVILYVDGAQVGTKLTAGASPESSGTKPVRIGANSRVTPPGNFFTGEVDEVRVWNDDLTVQQMADAFSGASFNTGEQVLYRSFGGVVGGYNYAPGLVLTGANYEDTTSSSSLQLSQFSAAVWFKTSTNFGTEAFIVNKGGIGSDSAGQNMNYQISMTSAEKIKVGFETSSGSDQFLSSVNTYNDGQWHYVVVTNDGSNIRLYIDGVQVAVKATGGASPESSGTKPVRVGANSRVTPPGNFFTGEIDEVRVWNDDLTAQQVTDAFSGISFNAPEQVLYLDFSSALTGSYEYGPSLSLSGPS